MPNTVFKNPPLGRTSPDKFKRAEIFDCVLAATGDIAICQITPSVNFRPFTAVFSDHTKVTLEVSCSSDEKVTAGTAMWAAVPLTADFLQFTSPVNAIRVTSTSGASHVEICV